MGRVAKSLCESQPRAESYRETVAKEVGSRERHFRQRSSVLHDCKVDIHGQADCPEDGGVGEEVSEESLGDAQVVDVVVFREVEISAAAVVVVAVEVDEVTNCVGQADSQVHQGQMDQYESGIVPQSLEPDIAADDQ